MERYIALLRGINVSGHKPINMNNLKEKLSELKFKNIKTYIQSGNVIFDCDSLKPKELVKKIKEKILKEYGFEVPVDVRTRGEIASVIKNNPFLKNRNEDINFLHVTFLSETPKKENIDNLKIVNAVADEFVIIDKTIYLFCPNGYGNTKLTNTVFENKLKVTATTRNWKTVIKLAEIANS
jgi:uncharacterized protein (DUF1697 family)